MVAFSGVILHLFVFVHMLGNLLILVGPEAYNFYSYKLTSNPAILVFEIALLLSFLIHMFLALRLTWKNRKTRSQAYAVSSYGEKGTSFVHRTLQYQGVIIFIFVVLHLITFKFGESYDFMLHGEKIRDFYRLVVEVFQNPINVIWYLGAIFILGFHISHGANAVFQSFGFYHDKWTFWIKKACKLYATLIVIGFNILPLYIYFFLNHEK